MPDSPVTSDATPPHKDRTLRLVLFGVIAIALGAMAAGVAAIQLLLPRIGAQLGDGLEAVDPTSARIGGLLYLLIAAAFVWLGIGSIRRRRWVKPMMLTFAWTWLLTGIGAVILLPALVDAALASGTADLPVEAWVVGKLALIGVFAAVGVVLPGVFLCAFHDRDVARTCERHDTRTSWTERCPAPVLGLAVGLVACGLLLVPMSVRPAVPVFGALWTGGAGTAVTLACAAASAALGFGLYRLRVWAWWGTTALLVAMGVSTTWTFWKVDGRELFAAMTDTGRHAPAIDLELGTPAVVASALITIATLVYMAQIRRHFVPGGADVRRTRRRASAEPAPLPAAGRRRGP